MKRQWRVLGLVFLCVFSLCLPAQAAFIDYRFSGTGVFGAVNDVEFNNSNFLISITGDTNNVVIDSLGPFIPGLSGSLSLTGGDLAAPVTGTFVNPLYVFVDRGQQIVGFGDDVALFDLLSLFVPFRGLDSYDLMTAFGPVEAGLDHPGTTLFNYFEDDFVFSDMSFGSIAFQNVDNSAFQALGPQKVSEPSTMMLLGPAFAFLFVFRKKRSL